MGDFNDMLSSRVNQEYVTNHVSRTNDAMKKEIEEIVNQKISTLERKANIRSLFIEDEDTDEFSVKNQLKALNQKSIDLEQKLQDFKDQSQ